MVTAWLPLRARLWLTLKSKLRPPKCRLRHLLLTSTATPRQRSELPKVEVKKSEQRKVGLSWVEITSIAPNPYQPRKHIDPVILNELADSIKELGIIQPPVVSYNPDFDERVLADLEGDEASHSDVVDADGKNRRARYLLIAGERRWQASKLAGLTTIPVVLKESTPLQMLEMALVENIQRADLNPLEEAAAYRQLVTEFKLTQQDVARRVGKSSGGGCQRAAIVRYAYRFV